MRGRIGGGGWFALGVVSGAALTAAVVALWAVAPVSCDAIGHLDPSPIRLVMPAGVGPDATVLACFDLECVPSPVDADADGEFLVPQVAPYLSLGQVLDVGTTGIYVEVRVDGDTVAANRFGIEAISDAPVWSKRCPGPFHYGPVQIG